MSGYNLPEGMSAADFCRMEGCRGGPRGGACPDCGERNYRLMGYYGAVARWAKAWGISEEEAEKRIEENKRRRHEAGHGRVE